MYSWTLKSRSFFLSDTFVDIISQILILIQCYAVLYYNIHMSKKIFQIYLRADLSTYITSVQRIPIENLLSYIVFN